MEYKEFFKEETHGFPSFWIGRSGEVRKCSDHGEDARRFLNEPVLTVRDAKDKMFDLGWVRIVVTVDTVFFQNNGKMTDKQINIIKDMSVESGKPALNSDTRKQLEEIV